MHGVTNTSHNYLPTSFAFRFLVEAYKSLHDPPRELRDHSLLIRIEQACRGHLRWLYLVQSQKHENQQHFGRNYWVTGKLIVKPEETKSWIAEKSLLDTGFQILKAAACMEIWDDKEIAAEVAAELMSDWAPFWLFTMKDSDKRRKYAWTRGEKEGVDTFRLDEHVWIWRALKSLEINHDRAWDEMAKLPLHADAREGGSGGLPPNWKVEVEDLRKIFRSERVQSEVSSRFTTENTVLRKRMLATARSVRESRFMLHARDTALLYNGIFDFLGENNPAKELWKTTVQSQMYHAEDQDSTWEKSLRYALHIMLGTRSLSTNNTPPDELVRTATNILIRSSSLNGFIPGRLETSTHKPLNASLMAEEDVESYYHASFEIPYILLTHSRQIREACQHLSPEATSRPGRDPEPTLKDATPLKGTAPPVSQAQLGMSLLQGDTEQRQVLLRLSEFLLSRSTGSDPGGHQAFRDVRWTRKRAVPFDRLVDSNNISKLDDEWLYKYPEVFSRNEILNVDDEEVEEVLSKVSSGPCASKL